MEAGTLVIVVNYNAGEALLRCVASVLAEREPLRLLVADNASSDGSCEKLRSLHGRNPRMEILENPLNLGFGPAVNACARAAREPLLLILNPDCELRPGALTALRQALEADPAAALAGPRVVDRRGRVLRGTLRKLPEPRTALIEVSGLGWLGRWWPALQGVERSRRALPQRTQPVEAVSGACMLLRADDFRRLSGFDEAFAMHFEDLDLMCRLRTAGRHCLYVPAAEVFHECGVSSSSRRFWVHRHKHRGMQRYFSRHGREGMSRLAWWLLLTAIWLHWALTLPLLALRTR